MAEQPPAADTPPQPASEPAPPAPAPDATAAAPVPDAAPAPDVAPVAAQAPPSASDASAQSAEDSGISKESIEELLKQANFDGPEANENADANKDLSVEQLLQQANFDEAATAPGADAEAFKLPSFQQVMADAQVSSIDLLRDVELNVKIELGRSRMLVEDVLKLAEGSVVELDKLAGDPVDVFVNDRLVARGEVLVLNDNFCVRVNEIVPAMKEEGP